MNHIKNQGVLIEMKKLSTIVLILLAAALPMLKVFPDLSESQAAEAEAEPAISSFEQAVEIIKKYETLHQPKHWPLVGYGHKVLPGEKFSRTKALSEAEADALLRKDLLKNCAVFREFGADSLLLGVLAYNIGSGNVKKSSVLAKLKAGDRDIRTAYLAHSRYRGKVHNQIQKRRIEEFDALYITDEALQASKAETPVTTTKGEGALDSLLSRLFQPFKGTMALLSSPFKSLDFKTSEFHNKTFGEWSRLWASSMKTWSPDQQDPMNSLNVLQPNWN